ncbi:uncharacterized protein H6S33_005259 [Morchella sextelata]|uniref:uncharacterized protein n=1 Tax=Morchella sextelata TaxID=1174677 RepID=UPI001D04B04A|nr:uncharacterized protein H6S33_005259 [Morchella sextelata]KAH0605277.1 hypothetical protein H6S33_005259 [Morchella sextelata]
MQNLQYQNQSLATYTCRFSKDDELVDDLEKSNNGNTPVWNAQSVRGKEAGNNEPAFIPGQPLYPLEHQPEEVTRFLDKDLKTELLDSMSHILWLLSSKNNINPLHRQAIRNRQILITEDPTLHLVWYYDQIFIKPIPRYLLNHAFFETYISGCTSSEIHKAANGFLRTYSRLIVYESDFEIAREKGLLPKDERITWLKWCKYIREFRNLDTDSVTGRYVYGELRLSRLNFYTKAFGYGWNYFDTYTQYLQYFSRFLAPYLFFFGSVSVILTAMQTSLAAESSPEDMRYHVSATTFISFTIWATGIGLLFFPALYLFFQLRELVFAITTGNNKKE